MEIDTEMNTDSLWQSRSVARSDLLSHSYTPVQRHIVTVRAYVCGIKILYKWCTLGEGKFPRPQGYNDKGGKLESTIIFRNSQAQHTPTLSINII